VSTSSYRSTLTELLYGLGQGSTSTTDIWGVFHVLIIHAAALAFVGIILLSVSGLLRHERSGEGFIDDTGLGMTNSHSTAMTPTSQTVFTNEEHIPHKKAKAILQFFLDLLHVIVDDLNTRKSACFILFHRWSGGKSSLFRKHQSHPNIIIVHPYTGVSTVIPRKEKKDHTWEINSTTQSTIR
jgi:hypothetical protein